MNPVSFRLATSSLARTQYVSQPPSTLSHTRALTTFVYTGKRVVGVGLGVLAKDAGVHGATYIG